MINNNQYGDFGISKPDVKYFIPYRQKLEKMSDNNTNEKKPEHENNNSSFSLFFEEITSYKSPKSNSKVPSPLTPRKQNVVILFPREKARKLDYTTENTVTKFLEICHASITVDPEIKDRMIVEYPAIFVIDSFSRFTTEKYHSASQLVEKIKKMGENEADEEEIKTLKKALPQHRMEAVEKLQASKKPILKKYLWPNLHVIDYMYHQLTKTWYFVYKDQDPTVSFSMLFDEKRK